MFLLSKSIFFSTFRCKMSLKLVPCRYYKQGQCSRGASCQYSHDLRKQVVRVLLHSCYQFIVKNVLIHWKTCVKVLKGHQRVFTFYVATVQKQVNVLFDMKNRNPKRKNQSLNNLSDLKSMYLSQNQYPKTTCSNLYPDRVNMDSH